MTGARLPGLGCRWSPNFDERKSAIRYVILHYTGMQSAAAAEARLCDAAAKVSAHYLLGEDGAIVQLVPEGKRAWHAGVSHWRGKGDLNSSSIGIELVNPGHEWGYRPFPDAQIAALLQLLADLLHRHSIPPENVLGHSDVAPARKEDPGELFPWGRLAAAGLARAVPLPLPADPGWSDTAFLQALSRLGYDTGDSRAAITAFQRRFRPRLVDGVVDRETRALLFALDGGHGGRNEAAGRSQESRHS